ncbi:phosphate transporter [Lindgomyces ingoldianus]|uniref:Phosphate transporter n=1 Tax=Lindgomyces ingoldianus TaxID=673940 RepID=A0ACB6QNG4_9PLEO|nr:phosphate transporter [Lindgomyces ingoldianus]KAF2468446.1 phosphate transporter [Lindgomyces ingoldianus]
MPNIHHGFLGPNGEVLTEQERRDRQRLRDEIDLNSFNLRIWAVAATGFFTDSYNLFATNVILPSLAFVYWPNERSTWRELLVNSMTLAGSIVGQVFFGWLGDRFGRTRLYGIELAIVIFSTIGVASVSSGYLENMSILGWLSIWRFVMGVLLPRVGIGAEYPLSAVITTEWSSTRARGRMIAAVFLMQPVGQLFAHLVGLWVLFGLDKRDHLQENCSKTADAIALAKCTSTVDSIWRIVTGVGAAPALIAILFRLLISDPGLYDLEVKKNLPRALRSTRRVYGSQANQNIQMQLIGQANGPATLHPPANPVQFSSRDLTRFFFEQKNWVYLAGTSTTWFLLDFSFYGLGMGNFRTLSKIWATWDAKQQGGNPPAVPSWNTDPTLNATILENKGRQATIYDVLYENARKSMLTVSIASVMGSLLFIYAVNYLPRRQWLTTSFLALAILFIITGGTFYAVFHTTNHAVTVFLVAVCHFGFNFGANTLTFMIPAEIFPTTYRCFCHGVSAAAGKLGSVVVLLILHYVHASDPVATTQGYIFIIFGIVMAIGAAFSWAWIPNIQAGREDPRSLTLSNKRLEDLGGGYERAVVGEGECIGFRRKWRRWRGED